MPWLQFRLNVYVVFDYLGPVCISKTRIMINLFTVFMLSYGRQTLLSITG